MCIRVVGAISRDVRYRRAHSLCISEASSTPLTVVDVFKFFAHVAATRNEAQVILRKKSVPGVILVIAFSMRINARLTTSAGRSVSILYACLGDFSCSFGS